MFIYLYIVQFGRFKVWEVVIGYNVNIYCQSFENKTYNLTAQWCLI